MSSGFRGPPLVQVSTGQIPSSGIGYQISSEISSSAIEESDIKRPALCQTPTVDGAVDVNLAHAMGATSISGKATAHDVQNSVSSNQMDNDRTISSSSSRAVAGISSNMRNVRGPPPPINTSRFSAQVPHRSDFESLRGPPPPMNTSRIPAHLIGKAELSTPPPPFHANPNNGHMNMNNIPQNNIPQNDTTRMSSQHGVPPRGVTPPRSRNLITPPHATSPKKASRIDSSQIPRPPKPQKDIIYQTRSATARKVPPLSSSVFRAIDKGNCSPRLMRVTMCAVPTTGEVIKKIGIPLAVVVTPFAESENGEEQVSVVDMGESTPRCMRCGGYVNPSVEWTNGGNKWNCNLCSAENKTPPWYFSSLDGSGQRLDRNSRPELCRGAVDFVVSKAYCNKDPQAPIFVFVVELSIKTIFDGSALASINAIKNLIHSQSFQGDNIRMGIITFDDKISFYDVRPGANDEVKVSIISPEDCFSPLPLANWLFNPMSPQTDLTKSQNSESMNAVPNGQKCLLILLDKLLNLYEKMNVELQKGIQREREREHYAGPTGTSLPGGTGHPGYSGQPVKSTDVITSILSSCQHSCPMEALKTAQCCLKDVGGRVILMTSGALNSAGGRSGNLTGVKSDSSHQASSKEREKLSAYGTKDEVALYCNLSTARVLSAALSGTDTMGKVETDRQKERNYFDQNITLAESFLDSNIRVDIFLMVEDRLLSDRLRSEAEVDLVFRDTAGLAESCDKTGGNLHYMSGNMRFDDNIIRLADELEQSFRQPYVCEAIMKLRTSRGLKLGGYYGTGRFDPLLDEVQLSGIDGNMSICYTVKHESGNVIKDEDKVHFQLAVLHTDGFQRKLVRVLNLTLISSSNPTIVFRHTDLDCVVSTITKIAVDRALRLPLSISPNVPLNGLAGVGDDVCARDWLMAIAAETLKQYRKQCSPETPRGQLILPEPLKLLPLYTLALLKHPAFAENAILTKKITYGPPSVQSLQQLTVRASERAFELRRLRCLPPRGIAYALYPKFYSMRSLGESENNSSSGKSDRSGSNSPRARNVALYLASQSPTNSGVESPTLPGTIILPPSGVLGAQSLQSTLPSPLAATSEALESEGIYLLDDGCTMYFIIGKNVPLQWLECVVQGVDTPLQGNNRPQKIKFLTGDLGRGGVLEAAADNIENVIKNSRKMSACKQELRVVWADDYASGDAIRMGMRLVEDSLHGVSSYVDFLCKLHSIVTSQLGTIKK